MTKLLCQLSCNWQQELEDYLDWLDIDVENELNNIPQSFKLDIEPNESFVPFETDLFVLIEAGEYASNILKLNDGDNKQFKKIATVRSLERGLRSPCTLFKCGNKLLALLTTDSCSSAEVTQLLQPYAELAKDVVTVQVKQMMDYKGPLPKTDLNFIRGINSKLDYVEELLPPNIISGGAAGIASWRSLKSKPVSSYAMFINRFSELETLYFLTDLGVDCLKKPTLIFNEPSYVVKRPYI